MASDVADTKVAPNFASADVHQDRMIPWTWFEHRENARPKDTCGVTRENCNMSATLLVLAKSLTRVAFAMTSLGSFVRLMASPL
jgi:hypothetical protein